MRALYRTSFKVDLKDPDSSRGLFWEVASTCLDWIFDPKRAKGIDGTLRPEELETTARLELGGGHAMQINAVRLDDQRAWGLWYEHPDSSDSSLRWRTELGLWKDPDKNHHFACSLLVGKTDATYHPVFRNPSRPKIVADILDKFEARGYFPLRTSPYGLRAGEDEAGRFVKFLEEPSRIHPVVVVAPYKNPTGHESCVVNTKQLASRLGGLAHVIESNSEQASHDVATLLTRQLACINGGVRIYWPGFKRSHRPNLHPLYVRHRLEGMIKSHPHAIVDQLFRRICEVAVFNVPASFLTWARLRELMRIKEREEARENGDLAKLAELYADEAEDFRNEIKKQAETIGNLNDQLRIVRTESQDWKRAYETLNRGAAEVETAETPPATVAEAVARSENELDGRVVFALNGKSEAEDSPFEHPEEVYTAFRWLGTTYYDARSGRTPNSHLQKDLRDEIPGWEFRPHQKKNTMKNAKWRDWYHTDYEGREIELRAHFKCGSGRDARECIRIAFSWDEQSRSVVVGFLGQHQPNTMSD